MSVRLSFLDISPNLMFSHINMRNFMENYEKNFRAVFPYMNWRMDLNVTGKSVFMKMVANENTENCTFDKNHENCVSLFWKIHRLSDTAAKPMHFDIFYLTEPGTCVAMAVLCFKYFWKFYENGALRWHDTTNFDRFFQFCRLTCLFWVISWLLYL